MRLTRDNIATFCAGVDTVSQEPCIDLGRIQSIDPFSLIYLGTFIRHWNLKDRFFIVRHAEGPVRDYMDSQNFWKRFNFRPNGRRKPKLSTDYSTSYDDIIPYDILSEPRVAELVEQITIKTIQLWRVPVDPSVVSTVVVELIDNAARHAQSAPEAPGALIFQVFPDDQYFEISLADCGVGIRHNLIAQYDLRTDQEAALKAFEDGVTSKLEGGTGLSTIREGVKSLNGTLFLSTGAGYVISSPSTEFELRGYEAGYDLPGVQVQVRIPF